jgi:peptidoglycan/xylan/chitin deacetylase (PgdA/CDA1 family)
VSLIRKGLLGLATAPGIERIWRPWTRGAIPILMLHRFSAAGQRGPGMPVDLLRRQMSELRRRKIRVVPLLTALEQVGAGAPVADAVVLTVDDGYADFHDLALPVFAEFECPVTVFLVTGFLDHRTPLWWDTVRGALARGGKENEASATIEALKNRSESERVDAVAELARENGLGEEEADSSIAPMTWDMVRAAAKQGVTFGPHTVTHPILSRVGDEQARFEIAESWRRVRQETDAAIPVFCYPNGGPGDQGTREHALVLQAGLRAAVTTIPGFVSTETIATESGRLALPRFPHPIGMANLLQVAGGLERLRQRLRHNDER